MIKVLFFLHKIGPYHHARFNALAEDSQLTVIEILPESKEYDWEKVNEKNKYEIIQINEQIGGVEVKGKELRKIVLSIFEKIKPELCIVTGWDNRTYYAALLEAKKNNIPVACISDSTQNDSKRVWYKEKIKSFIIKTFDAFLVAGSLSHQYLKTLKVNVPVFQPWDVVDNAHFESPSQSTLTFELPSKYLLCVARFIWEKNLAELIKGFNKFISDNSASKLYLVIIGSGPLKNDIENLIIELKCNNVLLIPFMQYYELPIAYSKAKALILPSIKDTWGLVVNEAMAAGLPVLVSEMCGCSVDLVQEGINGCIIKPDNEAIAKAISQFEQLSELTLIKMGNEGKEKIKEFSLSHFVNAILNIHEVLKYKTIGKINLLEKLIIRAKINL